MWVPEIKLRLQVFAQLLGKNLYPLSLLTRFLLFLRQGLIKLRLALMLKS